MSSELQEIQRSLGHIESKLDFVIDGHKAHDDRLTSLEGDRSRAKGILWGIGLGSASLSAFITKILGTH